MFGAHPEHLWLIYLVEGFYMIPRKFINMWNARPLNQALYYLDFCWCMNFAAMGMCSILVLAATGPVAHHLDNGSNTISITAREACFKALTGVALGPLMGANILLPFVACLFHDVNTMTGLFIHIMPPMVLYTLLWHSAEIRAAWPEVFHLTYIESLRYFPEEGPFFVPPSVRESSLCARRGVLLL